MPPYPNGQKPIRPKQTPGLIVTVPLCNWCRVSVGFPCKTCGQTTCYMCLMSLGEGTETGLCVHRAYKPVTNDGWGTDCPSPMCDEECNVCKGTGTV